MQFKEVNLSDLPQCDVLAYSPTSGVTTGKIMYNPVIDSIICSGGVKSIENVTHYLPLGEIKPESETKRTYFLYASLKGSNSINHVLGSRTAILSRVKNKPIDDDFSNWFLEIRKEFSEQNNLSIDDVIITSFSCTETT